MQLRPLGPVAVDPATGVDVLPVALDRQRGSVTRVNLFVNNVTAQDHNATITIKALPAIVVTVPKGTSLLVLDDIPVQETDSSKSDLQIHVDGNDGQGGAAFVAFGSFAVT